MQARHGAHVRRASSSSQAGDVPPRHLQETPRASMSPQGAHVPARHLQERPHVVVFCNLTRAIWTSLYVVFTLLLLLHNNYCISLKPMLLLILYTFTHPGANPN